MVNGGDLGCIVRDLKTIIVLDLLAFNFIPQSSHHSQTPPRSRFSDCNGNSNAWEGHNSYQSGVICIDNELIHKYGKKFQSVQGEQ